MLINANQSALLIIDVQDKLMPAIANGAHVLAQNIRLATIASVLGLPVIATEQSPEKLMSACCKLLLHCCNGAIVSGLLQMPVAHVMTMIAILPLLAWRKQEHI